MGKTGDKSSFSDYLFTTQADLLSCVKIKIEKNLTFLASKKQEVHESIDGKKYIKNLSDEFDSSFSLSSENLTDSQIEELAELYLDDLKAKGLAHSFYFCHPFYKELFVCRFSSDFTDSLSRDKRHSSSGIKLDIQGIDRNIVQDLIDWQDGIIPPEYTALTKGYGFNFGNKWSST